MNFSKYVGIPYKDKERSFNGVDCFGVCHLIYKEELGINLYEFIEYVEYDVYDPEDSHKVIHQKIPKILTILDEVSKPFRVFDIMLFYKSAKKDIVNHIGVYIGDNKFIHAVENRESMVSRLRGYYESKIYKVLRRRKDV